ncbi:unnamed protein product [Nesidiocoris tenuis]|uniref:Uncharacterized protein n=1 Tax=Nesidiocoris tenuis TaxID=355587 RepID=A0A6H5G947_9HEMI|nr:unnamed protein product [Nesidiocoris tenuis]
MKVVSIALVVGDRVPFGQVVGLPVSGARYNFLRISPHIEDAIINRRMMNNKMRIAAVARHAIVDRSRVRLAVRGSVFSMALLTYPCTSITKNNKICPMKGLLGINQNRIIITAAHRLDLLRRRVLGLLTGLVKPCRTVL